MKSTIISIAIALLFIGGAIYLAKSPVQSSGQSSAGNVAQGTSATVEGDTQFVEITAKGGYNPRLITAKAGLPLTLRMITANTFDCSASVIIPAIGYRGMLNQNGTTEIEIPPQPAGSTLRGTCGMGMYGFAINFN